MGAKNHGIVMPDASVDATLNALVAAGFGAAGQRCMALSTVVFVGSPKEWYYARPILKFCNLKNTALNLSFQIKILNHCHNLLSRSK